DDDVADLAGGQQGAGQDAPVDQQPAADAVAERDEQQAGVVAGTEGALGCGGQVGVVGDVGGQPGCRADPSGEVEIGPAKVGRLEDHAGVVDDAGRADADAEHRPGRCLAQGSAELEHLGDGGLPLGEGGGLRGDDG